MYMEQKKLFIHLSGAFVRGAFFLDLRYKIVFTVTCLVQLRLKKKSIDIKISLLFISIYKISLDKILCE